MPGSYLCRTEAVGVELFEGMPRYLENTYLAVRLALGYRFLFLDQATLVRHLDTPGSESKSMAYFTGQVAALRRILELDLPADVRGEFRRRIADACHDASDRLLTDRSLAPAWRWHARTLAEPGGWRYLPYTMRLVIAWWNT